VRLALAQYRELAAFAQFASDLDEATRKQLERGRRVTELMKQLQYAPLSVAEMAVTLYASNEGFMDDVDVTRILAFESDLHQFVKQQYAALMDKIASTNDLDKDAEAQLKAALTEFKKSWA
jgi:F-type H+-transporting ATPase subunit alpha